MPLSPPPPAARRAGRRLGALRAMLPCLALAAPLRADQFFIYDAYRPDTTQAVTVSLGTYAITAAPVVCSLRVIGTNPASRGYHVGIDTLTVTPSETPREAETQPATVHGRAAPAAVADLIDTNIWSASRALRFPATAIGQYLTFRVENDRWDETDFDAGGAVHARTVGATIPTNGTYDRVLQLAGDYTVNWRATNQTANALALDAPPDAYRGCAVRTVIRGQNAAGGGHIATLGGRVFVQFRAGDAYPFPGATNFVVTDAFIAEAVVSNGVVTPDTVPGTMTRLYRPNGATGFALRAGATSYMGYPAPLEIDPARSYAVTHLVSTNHNQGNPCEFPETQTPGYVAAYVIPASSAPGLAIATATTWSARLDLLTTNAFPGIQQLFGTFATNGVYTSRIFDTRVTAPAYTAIDWNAIVFNNTYAAVRTRSGNADMSDAASWASLPAMTNPGALTLPAKRYVQFQWTLRPGNVADVSPIVFDTAIRWTAATQLVNVSGRFVTGPEFGIWEFRLGAPPPATMLIVR